MKKKIFTACSVLVLAAVLFMACEKNNNTQTVTNAVTTSGSTTSSTGPNTLVVDGTSHTVVTTNTVVGSAFLVLSTSSGSYPSSSIYFTGSSAPAAGSYTANANYPTSGNCGITITPATSVTWSVVTCNMTVTSGSSRSISFTNSTFTDGTNTHTVTANLPF
ncbi:MAG: hypothetical protein ACXVC6_07590 [Bacteroidia bacterium]